MVLEERNPDQLESLGDALGLFVGVLLAVFYG